MITRGLGVTGGGSTYYTLPINGVAELKSYDLNGTISGNMVLTGEIKSLQNLSASIKNNLILTGTLVVVQ